MYSEQVSLLQGTAVDADAVSSSVDSTPTVAEAQPVAEKPRRGRPRKTAPKQAEAAMPPAQAAEALLVKKSRPARPRTAPARAAGEEGASTPQKAVRRRAPKPSLPPLLEVAEQESVAAALPEAQALLKKQAVAQAPVLVPEQPQALKIEEEAGKAAEDSAQNAAPRNDTPVQEIPPVISLEQDRIDSETVAPVNDFTLDSAEPVVLAPCAQADAEGDVLAPVVPVAPFEQDSANNAEQSPRKLSPMEAFEAAFFAEQRAAHAAAMLATAEQATTESPAEQDALAAPEALVSPVSASQPVVVTMREPDYAEAPRVADSASSADAAVEGNEAAAQTVQAENILAPSLATAIAATAPVEPLAEGIEQENASESAESIEADAAIAKGANAEEEDAEEGTEAQRKSRRGRRGGRSRKRKNKPLMHPTAEPLDVEPVPVQEEPTALPLPLDEEEEDLDDSIDDDEELLDEDRPIKRGKRKMFISVLPSEQVEVTIVDENVVSEYYLEMQHQAKIKGNIYKAVVHNIDTNLQAAFVNYGAGKNGFLQIDEIHPEYYLAHHEPMKGRKYPPIQKVLKAGQELLVQVVKEPNGSKGAFLTTWLSLAGRFLVLTPGQEQIGVSRKVENDEERSRLREMMNGIEPGEGLGVIVRTVSAGTSKTTLKNDLQYLKRVWKDIRKRGTAETAPCPIYQEPGLAERAVRDYLTDDVNEIWVDNAAVAEAIRETASLLFPRKADLVKVHADARQGMWERFGLQRQLEQIYSREVVLPSGGRLVFDQTEALLAIDINSGKISGKTNFEAMAHRTNMEAAEAIARQLKLRDVGGQVVIDFIEMRDKNHIRDVEKTLRLAMKNDRARHDVNRMSSFGLLELVRQRTGSSALAITMEPCPHCGGTGLRRNMEWQALQALRDIRRTIVGGRDEPCVYQTTAEVGMYLLNNKRKSLQLMEESSGKTIEISIRP